MAIKQLPASANISVCREALRTPWGSGAQSEQWHGEWTVDMHSDLRPVSIFRRIVELAVSGHLTKKISGLMLHRLPKAICSDNLDFSVSLFTPEKQPDLDIKNILLSHNTLGLSHCIDRLVVFRAFHVMSFQTAAEFTEQKAPETVEETLQFNHYQVGDDEEQKDMSPVSNCKSSERASFVVAKCRELHGEHVTHADCVQYALRNVSLAPAPCRLSFHAMSLSGMGRKALQSEIGYSLDKAKVTGRIYKFCFKENHSSSSKWPIVVPSYHSENGECLQVFFDHTSLQSARGVLSISIEPDDFGTAQVGREIRSLSLSAKYDISQASASLHQLRYSDPHTGRLLVLTLNGCVLLSLRFEFESQPRRLKPAAPTSAPVAAPTSKPISFNAYMATLNQNRSAPPSCPTPTLNFMEMPACPPPIELPTLSGVSSLPPLPAMPPISMAPNLSIGTMPLLPMPLGVPLPSFSVDWLHPSLDHAAAPPQQLLAFTCTPNGARFACTKLRSPTYFAVFFDKMLPLVPQLMVDTLGQTVCRALYSAPHCTPQHKQAFLRALMPSFAAIATNTQGSFALICLFSLMTSAAEIDLVAQGFARHADFDAMIMSQSGYHVIKKFLAFGNIDEVLARIASDFRKYACHHYGVPIIRAIMDAMAADERLLDRQLLCLQSLALHAGVLVSNQYGNYVMQHLLAIAPPSVTDIIKSRMQKKFAFFAKQKFASNVVEKCIKLTLGEQRRRALGGGSAADWTGIVVHELLRDARCLISHKFGNYCLQTALSACISSQRAGLLRDFAQTVRPLLHLLRVNVGEKWKLLLLEATADADYCSYFDAQVQSNFARLQGLNRQYSGQGKQA